MVYIDFDSVILDTEKLIFEDWKKIPNHELLDKNILNEYLKNLKWKYIIDNSPIINNSIEYLKQMDPNETAILTRVYSLEKELMKIYCTENLEVEDKYGDLIFEGLYGTEEKNKDIYDIVQNYFEELKALNVVQIVSDLKKMFIDYDEEEFKLSIRFEEEEYYIFFKRTSLEEFKYEFKNRSLDTIAITQDYRGLSFNYNQFQDYVTTNDKKMEILGKFNDKLELVKNIYEANKETAEKYNKKQEEYFQEALKREKQRKRYR